MAEPDPASNASPIHLSSPPSNAYESFPSPSAPEVIDVDALPDPRSHRRHSKHKHKHRGSLALPLHSNSSARDFSSSSPSPLISSARRRHEVQRRQDQARAAYNYRHRLPLGTRWSPLDAPHLVSRGAARRAVGGIGHGNTLTTRTFLPSASTPAGAARMKHGGFGHGVSLAHLGVFPLPPTLSAPTRIGHGAVGHGHTSSKGRPLESGFAAISTPTFAGLPVLERDLGSREPPRATKKEKPKKTIPTSQWREANRAYDEKRLPHIRQKWEDVAHKQSHIRKKALRKAREAQDANPEGGFNVVYDYNVLDQLWEHMNRLKKEYVKMAHGKRVPRCMRVFNPLEWKERECANPVDDEEGWEVVGGAVEAKSELDAGGARKSPAGTSLGRNSSTDALEVPRTPLFSRHGKKKPRLGSSYDVIREPRYLQHPEPPAPDAQDFKTTSNLEDEWTEVFDEDDEAPEIYLPPRRVQPAKNTPLPPRYYNDSAPVIERRGHTPRDRRSESSLSIISEIRAARPIIERAERHKRAEEEERLKQPLTLMLSGSGKSANVKVAPDKPLSEVIFSAWVLWQDLRRPQRVDFPRYLASLRVLADGKSLELPIGDKTVRDFRLRDGAQLDLIAEGEREARRRRTRVREPPARRVVVPQMPRTPARAQPELRTKEPPQPERLNRTWQQDESKIERQQTEHKRREAERTEKARQAAIMEANRQAVSGARALQQRPVEARTWRNQLDHWTEDEKDSLALIILCYFTDVEAGQETAVRGERLWQRLAEQFHALCNHSKISKSLKQVWYEFLKHDKARQGEISDLKWQGLDREIVLPPKTSEESGQHPFGGKSLLVKTGGAGGKPDPDEKPCLLCELNSTECDKQKPVCSRCQKRGRECVFYGAMGRLIYPSAVARSGSGGNNVLDPGAARAGHNRGGPTILSRGRLRERVEMTAKCRGCSLSFPYSSLTASQNPADLLCIVCETQARGASRQAKPEMKAKCKSCSQVLPDSSFGATQTSADMLCSQCEAQSRRPSSNRCLNCYDLLPPSTSHGGLRSRLEVFCKKNRCQARRGRYNPPARQPQHPSVQVKADINEEETRLPKPSATVSKQHDYGNGFVKNYNTQEPARPRPTGQQWIKRQRAQEKRAEAAQRRQTALPPVRPTASKLDLRGGGDRSTGYGFLTTDGEYEIPEGLMRESRPVGKAEPELATESKPARRGGKPVPASAIPVPAKMAVQPVVIDLTASPPSSPLLVPPSARNTPYISNPHIWTDLEERALRIVVKIHINMVTAGKRPMMSKEELWAQMSRDLEGRFGVRKDGRMCYRRWVKGGRERSGFDERGVIDGWRSGRAYEGGGGGGMGRGGEEKRAGRSGVCLKGEDRRR